jgi:hypothetical protein
MANKIIHPEVVLVYLASEMQWRRVLSIDEGTYVEVDLTPRNWPKAQQRDWEEIAHVRMRAHCRMRGPGDKQYRSVVFGGVIHSAIVAIMQRGGLWMSDSAALLTRDYLPEIDLKKLKNLHLAYYKDVKK